MYSILEEIQKHIKENNIPFKNIRINYSYFSKYINYVILEKLRKLNDTSRFELGPEDYIISFDNNGNIYLLAEGYYGRNKFIVSTLKDLDLDFAFEGMHEDNLFVESYIYEKLDDFRGIIREDLLRRNISFKDGVNIENKILRHAKNMEFDRISSYKEQVILDSGFLLELEDTTKKIIDYIDYLYNIYKLDNDKSDKNTMLGVNYIEHDGDKKANVLNNVNTNEVMSNYVLFGIEDNNIHDFFRGKVRKLREEGR